MHDQIQLLVEVHVWVKLQKDSHCWIESSSNVHIAQLLAVVLDFPDIFSSSSGSHCFLSEFDSALRRSWFRPFFFRVCNANMRANRSVHAVVTSCSFGGVMCNIEKVLLVLLVGIGMLLVMAFLAETGSTNSNPHHHCTPRSDRGQYRSYHLTASSDPPHCTLRMPPVPLGVPQSWSGPRVCRMVCFLPFTFPLPLPFSGSPYLFCQHHLKK